MRKECSPTSGQDLVQSRCSIRQCTIQIHGIHSIPMMRKYESKYRKNGLASSCGIVAKTHKDSR